ncbi:Sec-independent protein translocase protein TatA [Sulfidibacter corallicola]|uniref:Sec-independent protein translocase protein TatA n=1 Tax=Sulfidibacter corallicola TaxID=2818388 RepID=A0A8A4THT6_SULCO|nr:twin-arginine translocase TatA/TatE family subunit [Sulfidibacter corallicola]QTD49120.1 twin-arginine translocase TatA/TatE family subunit [Sulfidibacter corallicola]
MFGPVGFQEILVILLVAFLIFGPKRLPELGRSLGKGIREFKKSTTGIVDSINDEIKKPAEPTPAAPSPQNLAQNPATPKPSEDVAEVVINMEEEGKKG